MTTKNLKNRFVKAASLVFAILMLLALVSCDVKVKPQKSSELELTPVGSVGKHSVLYDELRYVTINCKIDMEAKYGKGIFDAPATAEQYRAELESLVIKGLASSYYAVLQIADEYYIGGSEVMLNESTIQSAVTDTVNETATECGSKKAYLASLKENGLTDRLYRFYLGISEMANELTYILKTDLGVIPSSEEELREYMHSDKFIRTNHVYIEGKTDEKLKLAESCRNALLTSDAPDKEIIILKSKYDSDFTLTTTHGVYFARYTSDYGDNYEKAAFALKTGEISEIVEGTNGYYVILRLPVEEQWLTYNFEDFGEAIIGSEFNKIVDEYEAELSFEFNEYGKTIDLLTLGM